MSTIPTKAPPREVITTRNRSGAVCRISVSGPDDPRREHIMNLVNCGELELWDEDAR